MTNTNDKELITKITREVAAELVHPADDELRLLDVVSGVVSIDTLAEFLGRGIARYLAVRGQDASCELTRTAPKEIYLQVSDDEADFHEPFPRGIGAQVTWCEGSALNCEVRYVRADLARPAIPENWPTDEMVRAGNEAMASADPRKHTVRGVFIEMMAAAGVQL